MTFVKGQSGNPRGRVPNRPLLTPTLRTLLGKRPEPDGPTHREQAAQALLTAALRGDVQALKLLFERIDGKLPEPAPSLPEGSHVRRIVIEEVQYGDRAAPDPPPLTEDDVTVHLTAPEAHA